MTDTDSFLNEIAQVIIECLKLEDLRPEDIEPDSPLFGEGLGLDSVDALEIALAISMRYGFEIRSDGTDNAKTFSSLRALGDHVRRHRKI